jgi:predicted nuclease of predicted toxin-antitoxin system
MAHFLIDVNLPYYFSLWHNPDFIHQKDINDEWTDEKVWEYARENNLTIITKDSDFSNKIIFQNAPPKVIHIRFGNLKMNEFFEILTRLWPSIIELNENYKLINVYKDRIEGIN